MYIEELSDGKEVVETVVEKEEEDKNTVLLIGEGNLVMLDPKKVIIGIGARALFYPTLLYNVVRNKTQAEFRWWDRIGKYILLGAVPFPTQVPELKGLGVQGVITLNEPYETLVPSSLYQAYDIDHLVIPTRDYYFAPSMHDISQAVDFIHRNASLGQTTYVHCKAGRGRSTTIVICYLVKHMNMTPDYAYDYVKLIRPRVRLAPAQWQAVQDYYHLCLKKYNVEDNMNAALVKNPKATPQELMVFDDGSVVVVTRADLEGYSLRIDPSGVESEMWADLNVLYRAKVAGQSALTRISCLLLRYRAHQKISVDNLVREGSCSIRADPMGAISMDIHVY